ncbi:helix-turn-helix domain-containing protein [Variovorax ureilyticus]|uniref:helix-turn-helix domain-containing protein n=1 Tax=Variovorax ureilyticus TaxID=1836198 RepID=UPI003D67B52E
MTKSSKTEDARALLASNLQRLRLELGHSQEHLAELAGFHRTYVSQVERRVANVTIDNIQRLAAVLEVPVAALFTAEKSG